MTNPVKIKLCINCRKRFDRNAFDVNGKLCRPCQVIRRERRRENKRREAVRYRQSAKGKAYGRKYVKSEKFKNYYRAWKKTIKGRAAGAPYGKEWPIISDAIRKRDDYTCQACGKKQKLKEKRFPVDHKFPFWLGGEHKEENLQTLCHSCHAKKTGAEKKLRKGNILGYRQWLNRNQMSHVIP